MIGGGLPEWIVAEALVVVEVLVPAGDAEDPLSQEGALGVMSEGLRGSGMAASPASSNPSCRSAWRSNRSPASEVIDPPENAATIWRRVVLEKAKELR